MAPASALRRPSPRLPALTGLRFFAATHVVFSHTAYDLLHTAPAWLRHIRACGWASVSFFFVLSGFILTLNYLPETGPVRVPVRRFWWARIARILPTYWLALALFTLVALALHGPAYVTLQVPSGISQALAVHAWFPQWVMAWNFPSWSIAVELCFYALFPLLARLPLGRPTTARTLQWLALCWLLAMAPAVWYVRTQPDAGQSLATGQGWWLTLLQYWPPLRLPEFFAGIVLGRWFQARRETPVTWRATALSGIGTVGVLYLFAQRLPTFAPAIAMPLFCLVIVGVARGDRLFSPWLGHRWLERLGDASYALYILQIPVAQALLWLLGLEPFANAMAGPVFLVYLPLLIALSLATHAWFELPVQLRLRPRRAGAEA